MFLAATVKGGDGQSAGEYDGLAGMGVRHGGKSFFNLGVATLKKLIRVLCDWLCELGAVSVATDLELRKITEPLDWVLGVGEKRNNKN